MISIKEAAQRAADYCQQMFPDAQDILLEEVEREDDKYWLITVSFLSAVAKRGGAMGVTAGFDVFPRLERRYKSIKIDAQNGEFISMKIRELQS